MTNILSSLPGNIYMLFFFIPIARWDVSINLLGSKRDAGSANIS